MQGKDCFNSEDLENLRDNVVLRIERAEQDHRVKVAELRGRMKQLDDMLRELRIAQLGEDTTDLPPNNTDTFKE